MEGTPASLPACACELHAYKVYHSSQFHATDEIL